MWQALDTVVKMTFGMSASHFKVLGVPVPAPLPDPASWQPGRQHQQFNFLGSSQPMRETQGFRIQEFQTPGISTAQP